MVKYQYSIYIKNHIFFPLKRRLSILKIEQLKYILVVNEEGSITKAAEKLFMAQPALSRSVNDLEKELNVKIFHRNPKGLSLTLTGEKIINQIEIILNEIDKLYCIGNQIEHLERIKIILTPNIYDNIYSLLINKFNENYPNTKLEVFRLNALDALQQISTDTYDLAIVNHPQNDDQMFFSVMRSVKKDKKLQEETLGKATLCIYCTKDNENSDVKKLLSDSKIITRSTDALKSLKLTAQINNAIILDDTWQIIKAIIEKKGIALIPKINLPFPISSEIVEIPITNKYSYYISLVYKTQFYESFFIQFIKDLIANSIIFEN